MPFQLQPSHLKNELIKLVPLTKEDFEPLFAVAADPLLWEQHPSKLRYTREVFQLFFDSAIAAGNGFLIYDIKTDELIGSSRFYEYDAGQSTVAIGFTFIARAYWGTGYNRSLKDLMLNYAFQFVDGVYFHVGAINIRSQKAVEKLGAKKVAEVNVEYYGGAEVPHYYYLLKKTDFAE